MAATVDGDGGLPVLREIARDRRSGVSARVEALETLLARNDFDVLDDVGADAPPGTELAVIRALGRAGRGARVVPFLESTDESIVEAAADVLATAGKPDVLGPLRARLSAGVTGAGPRMSVQMAIEARIDPSARGALALAAEESGGLSIVEED